MILLITIGCMQNWRGRSSNLIVLPVWRAPTQIWKRFLTSRSHMLILTRRFAASLKNARLHSITSDVYIEVEATFKCL